VTYDVEVVFTVLPANKDISDMADSLFCLKNILIIYPGLFNRAINKRR
jgi:hypothetical protein